ncbi:MULTISPECIES: ribosomal maturation YjgA family protein [unclassified Lacinutrix]
MKFKRNNKYIIASILLFAVEALIAIFLKDGFIRHTFGDYLVVILMYCMFKSFIKTKPFYIAIAVLIIAYGIEFLQRTNFLEVLNLQNNRLAILILGSTFSISDLLAYTLGVITILIFEHKSQTHA